MNYKIAVAILTCLLSCGDKKKDNAKTKDDAAAGPTVAPISTPPIGIDSIKRMNFTYGDGMREWEKAVAQQKTKSWAGVKQHNKTTLAKDPNHYDAHRALATALGDTMSIATRAPRREPRSGTKVRTITYDQGNRADRHRFDIWQRAPRQEGAAGSRVTAPG